MSAADPIRVPLRLPPAFHAEACAYADAVGLSLNALCAIALRQFLDRAKAAPLDAQPAAAPAAPRCAPTPEADSAAPQAPARPAIPKVAKGQPCPCGSRKPYGKCHGRQP